MLYLICGRTGTGKTDEVFRRIKSSREKGRHVFLLVPDREAVVFESRAARAGIDEGTDVVTFSRLCDYAARKYGGVCENYIGKGAKKAVMWSTLSALSPVLTGFSGASRTDAALIDSLLAARSELRRNMISPSSLGAAAERLDKNEPSRLRLSDTALILAAFDAQTSERFTDPDGILSETYGRISGKGFFRGSDIYIDAYSSFTKEQYTLISVMLSESENVCCTLPYDAEADSDNIVFSTVADTRKRLETEAEKAGTEVSLPLILRDSVRHASGNLAALRRSLFIQGEPEKQNADGSIRVISAANQYGEAEAVALSVCAEVRKGRRYREIAVVMRDPEEYRGIIDALLSKYGIPFFISERAALARRPLISFVMCALEICSRGFTREQVAEYIKTDLAGLSPDECDVLESYMLKWNINGKRFTDDFDWSMNPRGYGYELSEEDERTLTTLADIRRRLVSPLTALGEKLGYCVSVEDYAAALYGFLSDMSVPAKLAENAEKLSSLGNEAGAAEQKQLWRVFCDALDALVASVGNRQSDISEFRILLRLVLSGSDIGKIPTSVDEVLICDAVQAKLHGRKSVYIIGANDGVFPRAVKDDGFFSEREKRLMNESGLEFGDTMERRLSDELYLFRSAVCSPDDRLTLTYREYGDDGEKLEPCAPLKAMLTFFPGLCAERASDIDRLEGEDACFEYAVSGKGNLGRALRMYYADSPVYSEKLAYASVPLGAKTCRLDPVNAEKLFKGDLSTSYSKLEKYILCGFSYFCEYELRLNDSRRAVFGALDIGTLLHGVLEESVRYLFSGEKEDDDALRRGIRASVGRYVFGMTGIPEARLPERLRRMTRRLEESAYGFTLKIKEEFGQSRFTPKSFELTIGGAGGVAPMRLLSGDGRVILRGKIDRVDVFEDGEGTLNVRVVDYKTGSKAFDMKNISLGLDLQMLLYLFSLCENGESYYKRKISPAGIVYVGIKPPSVELSLDSGDTSDAKITTSGLFINDEKVLRAMDSELKGKYIPVKEKDITGSSDRLITREAFEELKRSVTDTVLRNVSELCSGNAGAEPCTENGNAPCEYCRVKAVCRSARKS